MVEEIPLSRPDIGRDEERLVLEVLRSGRLSQGPFLEEFEELVADRAGCRHAVGVSSGTDGLLLVLRALGIGPGDEVITTPFSFVASANVILMVGATPRFVDICPSSLNLDPKLIEAAIGPRTKAILAVEALGNPTHMDACAAIAGRHEIPLIEDCCEALGTTHKGRRCGSFGRAGVFGFYPNKQITTGEGGMIVTDDERLADACRSLRNQGRPIPRRGEPGPHGPNGPHGPRGLGTWLAHERLGYNCRLSELNAAVGVAQMRRLDDLIAARQRVARSYMSRLMGREELILPTVDSETAMSWFVFVVRLATGWGREERDRIIQSLHRHDVGAANYFPCIHLQPYFRELFEYAPGAFPIAESVSSRTIALPFSTQMTEREIGFVVQTLELMIEREGMGR
ncbi:MAG: DegT/DnrJ/EryC1/StrS family aminotransferase [Planctomycetota bacterium]|nr:DegT/DnrJ/EryC1/StrS family aminotransferase [Planctomycetota bacterium]